MILIFIRAIVLYIVVLIIMRLMGKREIGQLQPFELAISIMIADLASIPMENMEISIFVGIVPIIGLLLMHFIISKLNMKSLTLRKIICGKPQILINKGIIDENAIKKERITINELEEKLREKDVFSFQDVEYAILETSGQISVIEKEKSNGEKSKEKIIFDLIIDGKILKENLKKINKDEKWIRKYLRDKSLESKEILVMTIDTDNNIFLQEKIKK